MDFIYALDGVTKEALDRDQLTVAGAGGVEHPVQSSHLRITLEQ